MDKLALIKQKYGYVPNSEIKYNSKFTADKQNTPIKRAESHRKDATGLTPGDRQHQAISTKFLSQFCPPLPQKPQENQFSALSTRQPLKDVKPTDNQKQSLNENIIKSYEKTYDLLKNYRNRIIFDSEVEKSENQKKLILSQASKPEQEKQITEKSRLSEKEQKDSFVASQVSQRLEKRGFPKRCSPLEGIDLKGSCNVYAEIDNITRLQGRIHQLIGEKNYR